MNTSKVTIRPGLAGTVPIFNGVSRKNRTSPGTLNCPDFAWLSRICPAFAFEHTASLNISDLFDFRAESRVSERATFIFKTVAIANDAMLLNHVTTQIALVCLRQWSRAPAGRCKVVHLHPSEFCISVFSDQYLCTLFHRV